MLKDINFNINLIRHGESIVNAQPDLIGQDFDTPLSDKGRQQAYILGQRLKKEKFDLIYSSPYIRAYDTAVISLNNAEQIIKAQELREYDAGDWTGKSREKTLTQDIRYKMGTFNHSFLPPNGESLNMVERRASQWLEQEILYNSKYLEKPLDILIFSHGMTIKCLLHYIMGFDKSFTWKIVIDNTSISKISFGKDGWKLHSINDCSHLKD